MQASLVVLFVVSLAFVFVSAAPVQRGLTGLPPGLVLAVGKLIVLGLVLRRVRDANVYSMQWSSMCILLFVAEGVVRATSDPHPSAGLGIVEAVAASVYFVAVLAFLRPIKGQAKRQARADRAAP